MNYQKKSTNQEEPRCVMCLSSFYFRDAVNPIGPKCPHILICGHSACEGCLTSGLLKNKKLTCPQCNVVSEATKLDSKNSKRSEILSLREEFPLNMYAVGQISLRRNKTRTGENLIKFSTNKKAAEINTVNCKECSDRPADSLCRQCATELCNTCFKTIHNSVTLSKHEKISLSEKKKNELLEEAICGKHPDLYLSIYCKDCDINLCKECILNYDHIEHCCVDTFKQNEDKLPEFTELFTEANAVLKQLYATRKKLQQPNNTGGKTCDNEAQKVEQVVRAHYNHLHGILQRQEYEIVKRIHSVSENTFKSLESIALNVEKNIKEIENILSFSTITISQKKIKEFPLGCLVNKLANITATPCHLVLSDEEDSKFELNIDPDIQIAIAAHCSVDVPTNRVYQLCSKAELHESYEVEDLKDIPDTFILPDFKRLGIGKDKEESRAMQQVLLNAIVAPSHVDAKPMLKKKTKNTTGSLSASSLSLSSQESSVERICNVEALSEGSTEIVQMCHLLSPNSFYVQRKCNMNEIEKIRKYFSKNANRNKNPPAEIMTGELYLVHFAKDKNWYRGRVISVEDNFCDVFYVDYGNTERKVPKSKFRYIPGKYSEIPDQALHCGLLGCTPVGDDWTTEAYSLITSTCQNKDLTMYIQRINVTTGFHEVFLRCSDESVGSLTDFLVYYGCAVEKTTQDLGLFKHFGFGTRKSPFKNTIIKEGEAFDGTVTHILTPSNFYIQKNSCDGVGTLFTLMKELSAVYSHYGCNQGLIFNPSAGMPVAVKYEDRWYRAVVLSTPECRKVEVKCVDFGNVTLVRIEDIRELQPNFLRVGAQALKCSLNDIASKHTKGWPASATVAFQKMVDNCQRLRVQVEKVKEDDTLCVVLYEEHSPTRHTNINGLLVRKRHAISTGQTSAQAEYAFTRNYEEKDFNSELTSSQSGSISSKTSSTSTVNKRDIKKNQSTKSRENNSCLEDDGDSAGTQSEQNEDINERIKVETVKIISPSEIYFTSGKTPKLISKLIQDMTSYYTNSSLEEREWQVGDLCAVVKANSKWYRGVITEVSPAKCKVFIKDIVEVIDADGSMLRSLDSSFFSVPDGSFKVHLGGVRVPAGLKSWPASTTDFMRRLIEEAEALYIEKLGGVVIDSIPVCLWKRTQKQEGPLDPIRDEWCNVNQSLVELGFALPDQEVYKSQVHKSPVSMAAEQNVINWLDNSFQQPNCKPQLKENIEIEVMAEAPYVSYASDLENDETLTVTSVKSTRQRESIKERARFRSNRGRFPSQRASYIPASLGPEGPGMVTEWKPAEPFKKLQFTGQATYVDFECNIYVQDIENSASILDLLEKAFLSLFQHSEKKLYEEEYVEGQICVAFFEVTKKWYRGQVLKVRPDAIEVLFVDYGNIEELQPEQLRKQVTLGHIPIQCHKCRTDGIIPISPDGKWPVAALDFIHTAVVDKRCDFDLKPPQNNDNDYVILGLKLPGRLELLDVLLSMHYATYVIDCEKVGDQEPIDNFEEELTSFENGETPQKMKNGKLTEMANNKSEEEGKGELIEDHVMALQCQKNTDYDWYAMCEGEPIEPIVSSDLVCELEMIPRLDLSYKDLILPDSMVEFTVDVLLVCGYNTLKIRITDCEDHEVLGFLEEFNTLHELIQEEAETSPNLLYPSQGLVCIGCFSEDNTWYRAIIKTVLPSENSVLVYYVDYGNEEELPLSRVREIKAEWTLVPVQAMQVTLYSVTEGPNYDAGICAAMYHNCFLEPPYTMAIESRFPDLQVEIYRNDGELAYKPLLDAGLITKD